ncbi:MAG: hypothetical protein JKX70_08200 [Phycisphaerales bacterium]|nr:hypothetical protein [Phycisphaerales bacterium]
MTERILNILRGAGSTLEVWPAPLPEQSEFDREMEQFLKDRPSDLESILMDLRRSMISELDKLPDHERSTMQRRLRSEYQFEYERKIGLGLGNGYQSGDDHQLEFAFANS